MLHHLISLNKDPTGVSRDGRTKVSQSLNPLTHLSDSLQGPLGEQNPLFWCIYFQY